MITKFKAMKKVVNEGPRVLLIRHGHTALNASGDTKDRIRGWVNVPLNDEGIQDAKNARNVLEGLVNKVNQFYVSNLDRTEDTAKIVNQNFKAPMTETVCLRPWDLGELQGQETDKVKPRMKYFAENADEVVPEGESFNNFKKRYISFLQRVIGEANRDNSVIVLVTHFRNVKMAQAWIEAGMKADMSVDESVMNKQDIEPGQVCEIPIKDNK